MMLEMDPQYYSYKVINRLPHNSAIAAILVVSITDLAGEAARDGTGNDLTDEIGDGLGDDLTDEIGDIVVDGSGDGLVMDW